ncbi:MAG: hypothetical protein Fur0046_16860 [Cyanobacteria bacterium J069]
MKPTTMIFLILLGVLATVWVMRGLGILTFIPGGLLWLLLLGTIGAGVVDIVQKTRRW